MIPLEESPSFLLCFLPTLHKNNVSSHWKSAHCMTPEQFFKNHGVSRIEDLKHEELLLFALTCMDIFSRLSVQTLLSGAFGEPIDPLPDETDAAIIKAYNTGRSFCATCTMAEGVKEAGDTDLGTPGYQITVEDRSDIMAAITTEPKEEQPYKSPEGYLYPSYQAYCNDPDLDSDLIQCKLASGERSPQNDYERALLKEIKEARAQGKFLEIYPE